MIFLNEVLMESAGAVPESGGNPSVNDSQQEGIVDNYPEDEPGADIGDQIDQNAQNMEIMGQGLDNLDDPD